MTAHLGRSVRSIYARAKGFGLRRDRRFLVPREIPEGFAASQFPKGHVPANKGRKMEEYCSPEAIEQSKATRFRKGHLPHNAHPIGYECQRGDRYVYVKVRDDGPGNKMMVLKHRLVWERHNGPIPKGCNVQFKDGNPANCDIENLYLISRRDQAQANKRNGRPRKGRKQAEYEEMLRRALEPFRPTRTMDDVLKREAEIREASIDAYKEEARLMGKDRRKTETERGGFIPQLDYSIKFDF